MSKWNFAYQYDLEDELWAKHILQTDGDSIAVWLKVDISMESGLLQQLMQKQYWYISYRMCESYESKNVVFQHERTLKAAPYSNHEILLKFKIPKPNTNTAYLFIKYYTNENDDEYIHDAAIKIFEKHNYGDIMLLNHKNKYPYFERYVNVNDTLHIHSNNSTSIGIKYIKYTFNIAYPPQLINSNDENELSLEPDSTASVDNEDEIYFHKKGTYIYCSTNDNCHKKVISVTGKYPKLTRLKDVADPIIYIATDEERKAVKASTSPKKKLDDFWIDIGQDKELARRMIRNYYRKVEQANKLFTSYKEGWKTDQGMVYIIFGMPDKVKRTDMKETWEYYKKPNIPALRFDFMARLNTHGDYYWELNRSKDYTDVWNGTVELWRKGIIEK
ncbi:MAG: GWxTD domain-containing protein [Cytophagales bacterium]|nr:GWxTD domain-containing protein [Cytophagales bacterium]